MYLDVPGLVFVFLYNRCNYCDLPIFFELTVMQVFELTVVRVAGILAKALRRMVLQD